MTNLELPLAAHNCLKAITFPDGYTTFRRFTNQQMAVYGKDFLFKALSQCPSGVYLSLKTNGTHISFKANLEYSSIYLPALTGMGLKDWKYALASVAQTFTEKKTMEMKDTFDLVVGEEIIPCKLKKGLNTIELTNPKPLEDVIPVKLYLPVFPFVAVSDFQSDGEIWVDLDGAGRKVCYCIGDSITQGFNAHNPSLTYTSILGRHYDMETLNLAVGGYYFEAESLAGMEELPLPDMITVAYGTNDWGIVPTLEEFRKKVSDFFVALNQLYSEIPTYVISPIWRGDWEQAVPMGSFADMCSVVKEEGARYPENHVIDGWEFPLHDNALFGDNYLHPNAEGFKIMAQSIICAIGNEPWKVD